MTILDLTHICELFSEPARLKVFLSVQLSNGSLSSAAIASECGLRPSVASHHLTLLRDAGILYATSYGRYKCWSVNITSTLLQNIRDFAQTLERTHTHETV